MASKVKARILNATITKAGKTGCHGCGKLFKVGERVLCYRERATSNGEARAYGTLYPKRFRCAECLGREQRAFDAIMAEDEKTYMDHPFVPSGK
jgi:hypothetical protein